MAPAPTPISTLSLHDALPISPGPRPPAPAEHSEANPVADFTGERLIPGQVDIDLFNERSEEHTSELQSLAYLVCRLLLEKKKKESGQIIMCFCSRSRCVVRVI